MATKAAKSTTAGRKVFHRSDTSNLNNRATFTFDTDPSRPGVTRITLPEKSIWTPGRHWHEQHVEYFRVIQGRVLVRLGNTSQIATPAHGPVRIEKFVIHDFMRADRDKSDDEKDVEDAVVEEWTDPADGIKHVFFGNIFSILEDAQSYWGRWTYLQALYVAATYDDFIEVMPGRASYLTTHLLTSAMV
ncbi:hypothetical protein LTS08_003542 [Lithohypha guttulata]|nr:hypothetical protein LTS08_003542 [Lithohypha guttulata]